MMRHLNKNKQIASSKLRHSLAGCMMYMYAHTLGEFILAILAWCLILLTLNFIACIVQGLHSE